MAMQLLRQCWGNVPFTRAELQQLTSIPALGAVHAAGLRLLVHELVLSATQLRHLHPRKLPAAEAEEATEEEEAVAARMRPDAGIAYLQECREGSHGGWCSNPRALLSTVEEVRVLDDAGLLQTPPLPFRSEGCV